jgi:DNA invertase Pin-like site-specific DNA recombinase
MIYGYARVSTAEQDTAAQLLALEKACDEVIEETASGGQTDRPQLQALLARLQAGDVLVVYKLDRLSRSLKDLLAFLERIEDAGAGFRSLTEAIDTTTPAGRMMMQMLGAFAEFERAMIRERTTAGLAAARQRGIRLGRPPALTPEQEELVLALSSQGKSQREIARVLKVGQATVGRYLKHARDREA